MKDTEEEKILKLNHKCVYCNKDIFLGEGTIIGEKPQHFKCFKKSSREGYIKKKDVLNELRFHKKCLDCGLNICSCEKYNWVVDLNVIEEVIENLGEEK